MMSATHAPPLRRSKFDTPRARAAVQDLQAMIGDGADGFITAREAKEAAEPYFTPRDERRR